MLFSTRIIIIISVFVHTYRNVEKINKMVIFKQGPHRRANVSDVIALHQNILRQREKKKTFSPCIITPVIFFFFIHFYHGNFFLGHFYLD